MKTAKYTAPADWASYLINGDASGFDYYNTPTDKSGDRDKALADAFAEWVGGDIVDVGEPYFSRYCDAPGVRLAGDMAEYTVIVRKGTR